MANSVSQVLLTEARLDAPKEDVRHGESVHWRIDLAAGAMVDFWGVVREMEDRREIEGIDYEAHQAMAEHQMQLIADAASEQFQLKRILFHHRIGFVRAG